MSLSQQQQQHHGQDYKPSCGLSKKQRYEHVLLTFDGVITKQSHELSNINNFIALLKQQFNWWWIGFYFVSLTQKPDILVLGPFQGPLACTQIKKGKGVCGTSWEKNQSIIVEDVNKFPEHIACSSFSKSQIVIPLFYDNKCIGVLDIDSEKYSQFDIIDDQYLKKMINKLGQLNCWKWIAQKY